MMYRKFITLIAAASVAITGLTAAPARAHGNDAAKIIAGVAVLAIIGAAIASNNDNDSDRVTRGRVYNNGYDNNNNNNNGYRNNRQYGGNTHRNHSTNYGQRGNHNVYGTNNRPLPRRVQSKQLPRSCKVQARTRNGRVPAYSSYCLKNSYRYASSLPSQCSFKARTRQGGSRLNVYGRNCLASHGYSPANY